MEVGQRRENIHVDAFDVTGGQAVLRDERQEGVDGRMHEAAASVRFDVGAVDHETPAQLGGNGLPVVEDGEVEGVGVSGEPGGGQVGGHQAGDHGPGDALLDVGAAETVQVGRQEARGMLLGDQQGVAHDVGGIAPQPRRRRRHADRRPAPGGDAQVGFHVAVGGQPEGRVVGEDDGGQEIGTRGAGFLGHGDGGRDDGGAGMARSGAVSVVDVQPRSRDAVGEGGADGRGAGAVVPDGGCAAAQPLGGHGTHGPCPAGAETGRRAAGGVKHQVLGQGHGEGRDVLEVVGGNEF